jgi:hypothetical protein
VQIWPISLFWLFLESATYRFLITDIGTRSGRIGTNRAEKQCVICRCLQHLPSFVGVQMKRRRAEKLG